MCSYRHFIGKRQSKTIKTVESKFAGVNRLFVFIYSNHDDNTKKYKAQRYYLPKGIINNYNMIINRKNFYNQTFITNHKPVILI